MRTDNEPINPNIDLNVSLPPDFTPAMLALALALNAKMLNRVVGNLLTRGEVTLATPMIAALAQSAASMEQAVASMSQTPSQLQSRIAAPGLIDMSKVRSN